MQMRTRSILMGLHPSLSESVGRQRIVDQLPKYLYVRRGRYVWRNPSTGVEYGLGRDRQAAIAEAESANAYLLGEARTLVNRLGTAPERTLGVLMDSYITEVVAKPNTIYTLKTLRRAIQPIEGAYVGATAEDAADMTAQLRSIQKAYISADKHRMAQKFGSTMVQVFRHAAGMGWTSINPARELPRVTVKVKRSRLTWDDYQRIYAEAQKMEPWVCIAMDLALVTLQRRGDVSRMRRDHIKDGYLHVEQEKTGAKIRIPLGLKLNVLGMSLDDIRRRVSNSGIATRWLTHHASANGRAKPGFPVHPQTIARAFAEARDAAGIATEPGRKPASFHELRSLGIRLYQAQGYDPQVLAGHKDAATTAVYRDDRGAEWKEVAL